MKNTILALLALTLVFSAAAQVNYEVEADREEVRINTTAVLECEETSGNCPVNSWKLEWTVPENAEILELSDSIGEIEDYERSGDQVRIETNQGDRRTSEKIEIDMRIDKDAEKIVENLYTRSLRFPSFSGTETTGKAEVDNFISANPSRDLEVSYSNSSISFRGEGAANIKVNSGEGRRKSGYTFFGESSENVSSAYRIAVGTTGLRQSYPSIPVAVLSESEYNGQAADWSEGEYSGGVIKMRRDVDNFPAVLAEETVHAFNDEFMGFDRTSSSYLDEGLAGYVQSMVRKASTPERPQRELFGDSVRFDRVEADGEYSQLPSKGEREELWQYYQRNLSFMKSWSPQKETNRDFGYAYSELIIRNYVSKNNSLKQFYDDLGPEKLETNEEKWNYYSNYLDLRPCDFDSRERFERCLDRVNDYDYPVYSADSLPEKQGDPIVVEELDVPETSESEYYRNSELFNKGAASSILELLQSLWKSLQELI